MDARKLVGMTQGARKRKAHDSAKHPDQCSLRYRIAREYAAHRVGKRLRPCPGKHGCVNCTRTCGACEDEISDNTRCLQCGVVMTTDGPFCDGSGVIAAKARKVRR
jgi:hypothetical protein